MLQKEGAPNQPSAPERAMASGFRKYVRNSTAESVFSSLRGTPPPGDRRVGSIDKEMNLEIDKIKAICFDFGNTLIEFGPKQVAYHYAALQEALQDQFGHCDPNLLKSIRDRQIVAPFSNGYRENDLRTICHELIVRIYNIQPNDSQVEKLMQTRFDTYVQVVELPDGVRTLLRKLRQRFVLGLLSNYPCSKSVLAGLDKIGLSDLFESITISGDIGYVKPHAKPFEVMLSQLELSPAECVYIGDNWLADVQGAKRVGMHSVLTTQFAAYEKFEPAEGDFFPDMRIKHIEELERLFCC
ncbi:HAD family hydrolase [Thermodesulfobacteriota bacterium]